METVKTSHASTVTRRPSAALAAVGVGGSSLLLAVAMAILPLAFTSSAMGAESTPVCGPGSGAGQCERPQSIAADFETGRLYVADRLNNRIDVFNSNGSFAFAFGWGVANGAAELQGCGPAASPPTAQCRVGLKGGAGGAFEFVSSSEIQLAVDNDATSSSHHDLYVLERDEGDNGDDGTGNRVQIEAGNRVQKFDPEGHFLLAFGGGVIIGGAKGTGNLSAGSTQVTNVQTTAKTFELGQTIESPGKIPPETKVIAVGPGAITLSKPASATASSAPLSVAEGAGNVPVNEVVRLISDPTDKLGPGISFLTPNPSPSKTTTSVPNSGGAFFPKLPPNATAAELQKEIEALPNVGVDNVKVTEGEVTPTQHEYRVEFTGPRFSDTNIEAGGPPGASNVRKVITAQNGGGSAEVCTATVSCSGGIRGSGHGQLDMQPSIALGPGGDVYLVDCVRNFSLEPCKNRLQKFEPDGTFVEEVALPQSTLASSGLAVDSSGDFYASYGNALLKYDSAGSEIDELATTANSVGGLALDASGDLFASERDRETPVIAEYNSAGSTLRRFGYDVIKVAESLAPPLGGEGIYVSEGTSVMLRSFSPAGPILRRKPCKTKSLGNVRATLQAEVNPEGKETTVHFEYITEADYQANGNSFSGAHPASKTPESESIGSDFFLHETEVEPNIEPETKYHCRVVATNADGSSTGEEGSFTSLSPLEIGATTVSEVGTEEATLNAQVNPLGVDTTGYFEYVEEATYLKDIEDLGPEHGFDHAVQAPDPQSGGEIEFGGGTGFKGGSATVKGLRLGIAYRFRVVATNAFFIGKGEAGVAGPAQSFRTFNSQEGGLPDERSWELVSPRQKNGAEVGVVDNRAGFEPEPRYFRILAGSGDGNAITYPSWTSFGEAEGAPAVNQYLSKRTASGWQTQNISPFGFMSLPNEPPYNGFTPDLRYGVFKMDEPPLTPDCRSRKDMYLRDNETGQLHCLDPEVAGGPQSPCLVYAGASEDGSRVFLAGKPEGGTNFTYSLYEWTEASGPQLLSILPSGEAAPSTKGTAFGPVGNRFAGEENCQFTRTPLRNAVSRDGSKAFWTYAPEAESEPSRLFVRVGGNETLQLDAIPSKNGGKGPAGSGLFRAASADGSVAYFIDTSRLLKGSKAEKGKPDLYRYEVGPRKLTDLTEGDVPGDVQGVVGASDDGSYVYFVAKAALTGEEENETGEKAIEGAENLYFSHEGETHFVVRFAPLDGEYLYSNPRNLKARVAPDGRSLAFFSIDSVALAGYDNMIAAGEHCHPSELEGLLQLEKGQKAPLEGSPLCPQAFLFSAETGKLTCASCNPSGSRPLGPTRVPGWSNGFEGPRFLSDDGKRLFFESFDRLSDADANDKLDVYEFELAGEGNCTSQSPGFDPASDGCHFLLSSGKSEDESYFIDASADGRDAFFSTRQKLTGWDPNENYDVYDARAGGGFAEPPPIPRICEGEGCKPASTLAPLNSKPTTPHIEGAGNVHEAVKGGCRRGRREVRKAGKSRCVKPHKKHRRHGTGGRGR